MKTSEGVQMVETIKWRVNGVVGDFSESMSDEAN